MKKDDSSITKLKNRNQTVKRLASLFMESDVVDDSFCRVRSKMKVLIMAIKLRSKDLN